MLLIPELERIIQWEETVLRQSLIMRFLEVGLPFQIEVEVRASDWLPCFLGLQVKL